MQQTASDVPPDLGAQPPINLASLGRVRVLRALNERGTLSRAELVRLTGLARATVGSVLEDLIGAGLVRKSADPVVGARSGRPPQLLSLEPRAGHAVGLDIGHDHVRAMLTDLAGGMLWDASVQLPVDDDPYGAAIQVPGTSSYLAFNTSEGYVPPVWPSEAGLQQMMLHIDIAVDDVAAAVADAVELGATVADYQPQDDVRVLLDPAGHPFCLYLDAD